MDIVKSPRVFLKRRLVRQFLSSCRIRVEIVVHMNRLNIIPRDDVLHDRTDPLARLRQRRIEVPLFVVLPEPLRMFPPYMVGTNHRSVRLGEVHAIRIEPNMHLHTPLMRLADGPLQRIPRQRSTLLAGQPMRTRLIRTLIQCVRRRPNLQDNSIQS